MDPFHEHLLNPSAYPEETRAVAFKETHISRIYLTDNHAYKLKKPLNLGFLDFSTLEKRRHFCHEEVRLNRRFAADIYLGVVTLRENAGVLAFGKHGRIVDYAVQMRRLPEQLMLNRLIEAESPQLCGDMPRLGQALQSLLAESEICRNQAVRDAEAVRRNCVENFSQTVPAIGTLLSATAHGLMRKITLRELDNLQELMLEREARGWVRDGHGDLHTANICMTEPVCIYDCIEFKRRFRVADVIADLAFLIMDLEFLGRWDLADKLISHCRQSVGDRDCDRLLPFYKSYRAWVRGKVDAMLASDADADGKTRDWAARLACRYFNLALGYQLRPTVFLTAGLMGVGKTTLAGALAAATGARHLQADVVRKQLAGVPAQQPCRDDFGTGLYSEEMNARTYAELFRLTAGQLARQRSVIVDASFARDDQRRSFMALAEQAGCPAWLVHLACPDAEALTRLDRRRGDASDGRQELFARQKDAFQPITAGDRLVTVDTSLAVDYNVQSLLCRALADQEQFS